MSEEKISFDPSDQKQTEKTISMGNKTDELSHGTSLSSSNIETCNENSMNLNSNWENPQSYKQSIEEVNNQHCTTNIVQRNTTGEKLIQQIEEFNVVQEKNNLMQITNNPNVILKKETESLKRIMTYNISSEDESSDDESHKENVKYRSTKEISSTSNSDTGSSDSESDSSDSISVFDSSSNGEDDLFSTCTTNVNKEAVKGKYKTSTPSKSSGEKEVIDLPALPDLSQLRINYEKEEFVHIGNVQAIIDTIVTVEALPNTPAYDLDTVLFINHLSIKKPFGVIFDVIGPVANPIYCIRFNHKKEIDELKIGFGTQVYSAPKSDYTQYVFLKELMKIKGTDASWLGDNEIPEELVESSSDDEDPSFQKIPPSTKRKRGSFEKHRNFERNMNRCNSLYTRLHNIVDTRGVPSNSNENINVPIFNPSVPPPGFVNTIRNNVPINFNTSVQSPNFVPPQGRHFSDYPRPFENQMSNHVSRGNYSSPSNSRHHYQQWQ